MRPIILMPDLVRSLLKQLGSVTGMSSFFDSVARLGVDQVGAFVLENDYEFWDFGTLNLYFENLERVVNEKKSSFHNFLKKSTIGLDQSKSSHYEVIRSGVYNFTGSELEEN